jgi:biopolymer transport protein ExbB
MFFLNNSCSDMMNYLLQIHSGAAMATGALGAPSKVVSMNFLDLAVKGGPVMIPIILLSFVAVYIFIERFFAIKRAGKFDMSLMEKVKGYITTGKIDAATALCKSNDNPAARMVEKGISRIGRPLADITTAIENVGNLEIQKLEKGLAWLAAAAGGAPMLGFLGTVTGMVKAFYDMASAGNNIDITLLSTGIYQAMVTTVAGLIVGIAAYFGYNILITNVGNVVYKMEAVTTEFMDMLNEPV